MAEKGGPSRCVWRCACAMRHARCAMNDTRWKTRERRAMNDARFDTRCDAWCDGRCDGRCDARWDDIHYKDAVLSVCQNETCAAICNLLTTFLFVCSAYAQSSYARSTLDPMYDEGCPHRVADKSNCDLRPEWVTIFVSTPQRCTFFSRGTIHAIWCVPKENFTSATFPHLWYSHAEAFFGIPLGD